ncbi:hypothetical protein, partial [Treponema sp.]|uniref:hypothetical protein n=1 Tax=Treponema sp. TaxID=166 RepID=UPI0025FEEED5
MKKVFLILMTFAASLVFSQELQVLVIDSELEIPLEGVSLTLQSDKKSIIYTDEEGQGVIELTDGTSKGVITASLPGYKNVDIEFNSVTEKLVVEMMMYDFVEGAELIVNRAAPENKSEKAGVSQVITKEEMQTTANVGLVEDCMASVRTLPGVSFSGIVGDQPSIRGGEPREMVCLLDGMYTIFPWHWGG